MKEVKVEYVMDAEHGDNICQVVMVTYAEPLMKKDLFYPPLKW